MGGRRARCRPPIVFPAVEERRRISASAVLSALAIIGPLTILGAWWVASLQDQPTFDIGRKIFGNVPGPVKALFYVGTAAAVGLMFHLFSLRARNW